MEGCIAVSHSAMPAGVTPRRRRTRSKLARHLGAIETESDSYDQAPQRLRCAELVARGGVESPIFRFSGLGTQVRQVMPAFVTCIETLIRTPLNANEHMRMRPKMSPLLQPLASCGWRKVFGSQRYRSSGDLAGDPATVGRLALAYKLLVARVCPSGLKTTK